jgi:hypothetical protein
MDVGLRGSSSSAFLSCSIAASRSPVLEQGNAIHESYFAVVEAKPRCTLKPAPTVQRA